MTTEGVLLPGLNGETPLGFLAALGTFRALDSRRPGARPRLAWRFEGRWRPVLHGAEGLDETIQAVAEDAAAWAGSALLRFRYPKVEKRGEKLVGALRPPVALLRGWLQERLEAEDLEALSYAAALTAETAIEPMPPEKVPRLEVILRHGLPVDDAGSLDRNTLPTAFDFTSRNAQFLEQVEHLRDTLTTTDFDRALKEGTPQPEASRTLDWDPTADAPGAIYSTSVVGSRPATEWLAFRGLAFFPVVGRGSELDTTACRGRRKEGVFTWPLWEAPTSLSVAASLIGYPRLEQLSIDQRRELGIGQVFRSTLTKKADGYSGMFSPSEPV